MRRFIIVALVAIVGAGATGVSSADARQHMGLSEKYQHEYWKGVRLHGKQAVGRNIVYRGVKHKGKPARPATKHEKAKSLRQLRLINNPPALPVPPAQPPAGVQSVAPNSGLATCIINSESGGNTQAVNGQYSGIAQWSAEAWARMGGTKYASSPTGASYQEQVVVLTNGLAQFGCADWCPYDPC